MDSAHTAPFSGAAAAGSTSSSPATAPMLSMQQQQPHAHTPHSPLHRLTQHLQQQHRSSVIAAALASTSMAGHTMRTNAPAPGPPMHPSYHRPMHAQAHTHYNSRQAGQGRSYLPGQQNIADFMQAPRSHADACAHAHGGANDMHGPTAHGTLHAAGAEQPESSQSQQHLLGQQAMAPSPEALPTPNLGSRAMERGAAAAASSLGGVDAAVAAAAAAASAASFTPHVRAGMHLVASPEADSAAAGTVTEPASAAYVPHPGPSRTAASGASVPSSVPGAHRVASAALQASLTQLQTRTGPPAGPAAAAAAAAAAAGVNAPRRQQPTQFSQQQATMAPSHSGWNLKTQPAVPQPPWQQRQQQQQQQQQPLHRRTPFLQQQQQRQPLIHLPAVLPRASGFGATPGDHQQAASTSQAATGGAGPGGGSLALTGAARAPPPHAASAGGVNPYHNTWSTAFWLPKLSPGARNKGVRLAHMLDGIMETDVPHMFRVHSTSGRAEWRAVDMAAGCCACPNRDPVCSHLFAVALSRPQYRPQLALALRARAMLSDTFRRTGRPPEPSDLRVICDELARGVAKQVAEAEKDAQRLGCASPFEDTASPAAAPGGGSVGGNGAELTANASNAARRISAKSAAAASACRLAVESVVMVLLQEQMMLMRRAGGAAQRLWWQGMSQVRPGAASATSDLAPSLGPQHEVTLEGAARAVDAAIQAIGAQLTSMQQQQQQQGADGNDLGSSSSGISSAGGSGQPSPPPLSPAGGALSVAALLLEVQERACALLGADDLPAPARLQLPTVGGIGTATEAPSASLSLASLPSSSEVPAAPEAAGGQQQPDQAALPALPVTTAAPAAVAEPRSSAADGLAQLSEGVSFAGGVLGVVTADVAGLGLAARLDALCAQLLALQRQQQGQGQEQDLERQGQQQGQGHQEKGQQGQEQQEQAPGKDGPGSALQQRAAVAAALLAALGAGGSSSGKAPQHPQQQLSQGGGAAQAPERDAHDAEAAGDEKADSAVSELLQRLARLDSQAAAAAASSAGAGAWPGLLQLMAGDGDEDKVQAAGADAGGDATDGGAAASASKQQQQQQLVSKAREALTRWLGDEARAAGLGSSPPGQPQQGCVHQTPEGQGSGPEAEAAAGASSAAVPEEVLVEFVRQVVTSLRGATDCEDPALASSGANNHLNDPATLAAHVEDAACAQFGVASFAALGHGPTAEALVTEVLGEQGLGGLLTGMQAGAGGGRRPRHLPPSGGSSSRPLFAQALLAGLTDHHRSNKVQAAAGGASEGMGPLQVPELFPLPPEAAAAAAASAGALHPSAASRPLAILCLPPADPATLALSGSGAAAGCGLPPNSRCLLVPSSASVGDLAASLRRWDGRGAVSALMGLLAAHGGAGALPWQLLRLTADGAVEHALQAAEAAAEPAADAAADAAGLYLLDVACCLPGAFLAHGELLRLLVPRRLADLLLPPPAPEQATRPQQQQAADASVDAQPESGAVALQALRLARSLPSKHLSLVARRSLAALGGALGVRMWVEDWMAQQQEHDGPHEQAQRQEQEQQRQGQQPESEQDQEKAQQKEGKLRSGPPSGASVPAAATADDDGAAELDTTPQQTALHPDAACGEEVGPRPRQHEEAEEPAVGPQTLQTATPSAAAGGVTAAAAFGGGKPAAAQLLPWLPQPQLVGSAGGSASGQGAAAAARAVIEDIRQREFGIGLAASPELSAVLSAQHARLRRAMERLAADLYSSRVHLLLELLQNADDCTYPQGVVPSLALWVGPSGVAMATNEVGFCERDVRALCDVGASSKAAAKGMAAGQQHMPPHERNQGHGAADGAVAAAAAGAGDAGGGKTGEKGIGFKSVFALTDRPHIVSNHFSFCFDANHPSGIGYVLPTWIEAEEEAGQWGPAAAAAADAAAGTPTAAPWPPQAGAPSEHFEGSSGNSGAGGGSPGSGRWSTFIWLPAARRLLDAPAPAPVSTSSSTGGTSGSDSGNAWSSLAAELLREVQPGLLLFLRRVRRLTVTDALHGRVHTLVRTDTQLPAGDAAAAGGDDGRGGGEMQVEWSVRCTASGSTAVRRLTWIKGELQLQAPPLPRRGALLPATSVSVALLAADDVSGSGTSSTRRQQQRRRQEEGAGGAAAASGCTASPPGAAAISDTPSDVGQSNASDTTDTNDPTYDPIRDNDNGGDPIGGCYAGTTANGQGGGGSACAAVAACVAAPHTPQLYAFLPVRPVGLPFDLQADWLLTSSREDVVGGEGWNQWLREQVPAAFVRAVELCKRHPRMRAAFLQAIPQPGAAAAFFRPLTASIPAALRSAACIPTACGGWARPGEVLLAAAEVQRLVPPAAVLQVLGSHYAHPQLAAALLPPPALPQRQGAASGTGADSSADGADAAGDVAAASGSGSWDAAGAAAALRHLGVKAFSAQHLVQVLASTGGKLPLMQGAESGGGEAGGAAAAAWRVLALLEQLLEEDAGAPGGVSASASGGPAMPSKATLPHASGPPRQQQRQHHHHHHIHHPHQLLSALSDLPLIPLAVGGRLATPRQGAFLPAGFDDLVARQLEVVEASEDVGRVMVAAGALEGHMAIGDDRLVARVSAADNPAGGEAAAEAAEAAEAASPAAACGVLGEGFRYGFEDGLPLVDTSGLSALSSEQLQLAVRCLWRLGVRHVAPQEVIHRHVLPALKSSCDPGAWKGREHELVGYAAFLLHHQHLAAASPQEAAEWRQALMWVLVPPAPAVEAAEQQASPDAPGPGGESKVASGRGSGPSQVAPGPAFSAVVPSSEGISLGLTANAWSQQQGQGRASAGRPGAAARGNPAASSALGAASSLIPPPASTAAGSSGVLQAALPPLLLQVAAEALAGTRCVLHRAYLGYGSAHAWGEFLQGVLGCGSSLLRVRAVQRRLAEAEVQQALQAAAQRQPQAPAALDAQLRSAHVTDYTSPDLEALLQHLIQATQLTEETESPSGAGGSNSALSASEQHLHPHLQQHQQRELPRMTRRSALEALSSLWQALDAMWASELSSCAQLQLSAPETAAGSSAGTFSATTGAGSAASASRSTAGSVTAASAEQQLASLVAYLPSSLVRLLREAPCIPISRGLAAASESAPLRTGAKQQRRQWQRQPNDPGDSDGSAGCETARQQPDVPMWLVAAVSTHVLLPTGANTRLFGPDATYALVAVGASGLADAVGLCRDPDVGAALAQLRRWSSSSSSSTNTTANTSSTVTTSSSREEACRDGGIASHAGADGSLAEACAEGPGIDTLARVYAFLMQEGARSSAGGAADTAAGGSSGSVASEHSGMAAGAGEAQASAAAALIRAAFHMQPLIGIPAHGPNGSCSSIDGVTGAGMAAAAGAAGAEGSGPSVTVSSSSSSRQQRLAFVLPRQAVWHDDTGVVCSTQGLAVLGQHYPDSLRPFFVEVLGVAQGPPSGSLMTTLIHAKQQQLPALAWACLGALGSQLLARPSASPDANAKLPEAPEAEHELHPAEAAVPAAAPVAADDAEALGSQHVGDLVIAGSSWQHEWWPLLMRGGVLPAAGGAWVSSATDGLYVWWQQGAASRAASQVEGAHAGPITLQSSNRQQHQHQQRSVDAAVVDLLQAAAAEAGSAFVLLRPDADAQADPLVTDPSRGSGIAQQRLQQAGLRHLLHVALGLPDLSFCIKRAAASATHGTLHTQQAEVAIAPPSAGHVLAPPYPRGAYPAPSVLHQLRRYLPTVLRHLMRRQGRQGLQALAASGAAHRVRRLQVAVVPDLCEQFTLGDGDKDGVATLCAQPRLAWALLDAPASPEGPHMLYIRGEQPATSSDNLAAADPSDEWVFSLQAWRDALAEFSRLFSSGGQTDPELAGLLVLLHSLRGQPDEVVAAALSGVYGLAAPGPGTSSDWADVASSPAGMASPDAAGEPTEAPDSHATCDPFAPGAWAVGADVKQQEQQQQRHPDARDPRGLQRMASGQSDSGWLQSMIEPEQRYMSEEEQEEVIVWPGAQPQQGQQQQQAQQPQQVPQPRHRLDGTGSLMSGGGREAAASSGQGGPGRPHAGSWLHRPTAAFVEEAVQVHSSAREAMAPLPMLPDSDETAARKAVGLWGEELVYKHMQQSCASGETVEWMNAGSERGLPYDLVQYDAAGTLVAFIEVKATRGSGKHYFEMSHREWLFAQSEGARYHIYRVYGAGAAEGMARIVRVVNPYLQWRSQQIGICLAL